MFFVTNFDARRQQTNTHTPFRHKLKNEMPLVFTRDNVKMNHQIRLEKEIQRLNSALSLTLRKR